MNLNPREFVVRRPQVEQAIEESADSTRSQRTYYLTDEVISRAGGAVYWALPMAISQAQTAGEEADTESLAEIIPSSVSALVEHALWAEILRLESLFNNGKPFPAQPGKLATGPSAAGIARLRQPRKKS